jgi:hypothetical protein
MGLHSADRPQRVALTALKTAIVRGEHQRRRDEFVDRGLATIRDGYTASQIPDLTRKVWQQSLGANCIDQQFRTQLCFLFGNSMLLRLSNRLPMELPDLFSMPLPREGPKGDGWCLVTVMDQGKTILHCFSLSFLLSANFCIVFPYFYKILQQALLKNIVVIIHCNSTFYYFLLQYLQLTTSNIGKTNQHGRLEYGAALRHRDYRSCLVGALATYFFWRWHCSGESFPCFRTSQDWYNIKVLKRDNAHLQELLSDSTASAWTRRLYDVSSIKCSKVSHAPRISGTRLAELRGVSEDQVSKRFYLL